MVITLRLSCRADGLLDYSKDGLGAFRSVLPPDLEKVEGQLRANDASQEEVEKFIAEFNLRGAAVLSFPERRCSFFVL